MNAADLKTIDLLAEFSDEDREALVELLEEQSLVAGRRVYSERAEADSMVLLLEGKVRVESSHPGKPEFLEAGATLGALALVSVGAREATIFCEEACRLARLERSAYRRLVDDYPRTACRLMEAIAGELADNVREILG